MSHFEKFKNTLFNENELTCYGQHHTAVACNPVSDIIPGYHQLIGLNPMIESRRDSNVQVFRNFLVEQDSGTVDEQLHYIKSMGLPYTSAVFSGNKSVHFVISLDKPLVDLNSYKYVAKWILRILKNADQATVNPSRFTRVPGTMRSGGKMQEVIELKERVERETLNVWLHSFPKERPTQTIQHPHTCTNKRLSLPRLALEWLVSNDFPKGERNCRWYWIACRCKDAGYSFEETIRQLGDFFNEEINFDRSEWTRTVESAFKK